jgi:hypothetical protein
VFVMLPLDTIKVVHHPDGTSESCIQNEVSLDIALQTLKSVGVQVLLQRRATPARNLIQRLWCGDCSALQIHAR